MTPVNDDDDDDDDDDEDATQPAAEPAKEMARPAYEKHQRRPPITAYKVSMRALGSCMVGSSKSGLGAPHRS